MTETKGQEMPPVVFLMRARIDITFNLPNPPIGVGYLASSLETHGFKTRVIDFSIRKILPETLEAMLKVENVLFVGLSCLTANYESTKRLARTIKNRCPELPLVVGGVHASSLPEQVLDECEAEIVVVGEGEMTIVDIARALSAREKIDAIPGIVYKKNGVTKRTPRRELIKDLDSLPMPAWFKIDPRKYPPTPHGFITKKRYVAPIISTRGCPFDCHYCASCQFWGRTIRFRDPAKVVDEIEYLHRHFGISEFHFWDDNLTLKRSHITGICKEILARKLRIFLSTPNGVRVDFLNEKILRLMKAAGFYALTFAVESGSPKILRENGKKISIKRIVENSLIAKKMGFTLLGYFMIGFPNDTPKTMKQTVDLAVALPYDMKSFFVVKPLPGSKLFAEATKEMDLNSAGWREFDFFDQNLHVCKAGLEVVKKWHSRAYKRTILRGARLLKFSWFRFVKYGHLFQLRYSIKRIKYVILS